MAAHPVQLHVQRSAEISRIQVLVRLVLMLGATIVSASSVYWLLYLEVPALVALAIRHRGREHYLSVEGPRLVAGLRWLAGAFGYLCFLTDAAPSTSGGPVDLAVEVDGVASASSAFARLVVSLPALLLVAALIVCGTFVWMACAAWTLITGRVPGPFADFFELLVRTQMRLFAYHLSLVDRYPSLEEERVQPALGAR